MFDVKKCDLRGFILPEIDENFLLEIYEKVCLNDCCPEWDNESDPDKLLRLSAASYNLCLVLENCCVRELKDGIIWVVHAYGEDGKDQRDHEDHDELPSGDPFMHASGHWPLNEGRSPHWLDYRIKYHPNFNPHSLIDLHHYFLKDARSKGLCGCDDLEDWCDEV